MYSISHSCNGLSQLRTFLFCWNDIITCIYKTTLHKMETEFSILVAVAVNDELMNTNITSQRQMWDLILKTSNKFNVVHKLYNFATIEIMCETYAICENCKYFAYVVDLAPQTTNKSICWPIFLYLGTGIQVHLLLGCRTEGGLLFIFCTINVSILYIVGKTTYNCEVKIVPLFVTSCLYFIEYSCFSVSY